MHEDGDMLYFAEAPKRKRLASKRRSAAKRTRAKSKRRTLKRKTTKKKGRKSKKRTTKRRKSRMTKRYKHKKTNAKGTRLSARWAFDNGYELGHRYVYAGVPHYLKLRSNGSPYWAK